MNPSFNEIEAQNIEETFDYWMLCWWKQCILNRL